MFRRLTKYLLSRREDIILPDSSGANSDRTAGEAVSLQYSSAVLLALFVRRRLESKMAGKWNFTSKLVSIRWQEPASISYDSIAGCSHADIIIVIYSLSLPQSDQERKEVSEHQHRPTRRPESTESTESRGG